MYLHIYVHAVHVNIYTYVHVSTYVLTNLNTFQFMLFKIIINRQKLALIHTQKKLHMYAYYIPM
jgi:hypothetical protein